MFTLANRPVIETPNGRPDQARSPKVLPGCASLEFLNLFSENTNHLNVTVEWFFGLFKLFLVVIKCKCCPHVDPPDVVIGQLVKHATEKFPPYRFVINQRP